MATTNAQPDNYGIAAKAATQQTPDSQSSSSANTAQNQVQNGTQIQSGSQTNMSPEALAALELLIKQLMGGGTQAMANDQAARKGEINKVTQQRAAYSKDAAFSDAQGLIAQTMRRAMEQLLPSINRSAEGAGASQSSLRALLLQDAANKAAESSAAQGLNAAVQYGQVGANLSQVLEALTRPDTTVSNALLNALQIAKGATSTSNTVTQTTGQTQTSGSAQEKKTVDYAPFSFNPPGRQTGLTFFGPLDSSAPTLAFQNDDALRAKVSELISPSSFSNFTF